jgi:polo-like kinase 1
MESIMELISDVITRTRVSQTDEVHFQYYTKGKFLGKGGFANCFELYEATSGKLLAAKIIDKEKRVQQKLQSERRIHQSLIYPNIVRFEDSKRVYILLELCNNKTLKDISKKKRLHELEVRYYIAQLISGVNHIHAHNVIYRDLKLGNLFLGNHLDLKISDFGLVAKLNYKGERRKTVCGTPNYIAPEVLNSKVCGHSFEADIWSIGIIIYTMLIGRPPFESNNVKLTYKRIKANNYSIPDELSSDTKSLIANN